MKKITFKALVREEIRKVLKEENPSVDVQDFDAIEANVAAALPELETLIKNQIGATIKLKVEQLRSKPTLSLEITSDDLIKMLGNTLVKTLFTSINVRFWGGTVVRDGNAIWFNPKIEYAHPSGGTNGTDFIWDALWYVLKDHGQYKAGQWVTGRVIL